MKDFRDNGSVSIIMLSHGDSTYVVETVKSVLAQTYQNWELLFVAKTNDETLDAFSELREEDVKKQIEAGKEWPSGKYGRSRIRTSYISDQEAITPRRNSALNDAKPSVLKNNKVIFGLDASGGKNHLKWCFSSLDVKIDSLHSCRPVSKMG